MQHSSYKELINRIESYIGLIFVNTFEEKRLIEDLYSTYSKLEMPTSIQFWSATQGLHCIDDKMKAEIYKYASSNCRKGPSGASNANPMAVLDIIENDCREKTKHTDIEKRDIYVLRDAAALFNNPMFVRKLRDVIYICAVTGSPIIITGADNKVPTELEKDCALINLGLPTREEIKSVLDSIIETIKAFNAECESPEDKINLDHDISKLVNACSGLTIEEIYNTCAYSKEIKKALDINIIVEEKKNIINKNDILEFWPCEEGLNSVGGFDNFKDWFKVQKAIMDNPEIAAEFQAEPPKGCLLIGLQGSGKSHIAKAAAKEWGKGIIKLDMGRVFAGVVGESERRARMALAQAEAAGGVIIIDELDKGLAGAGSSDKTDGGTTKRVIGTLLTWMQERHDNVFIVATANDLTAIRNAHPELLRKGRFDNIFFADAPTREERKEIFKIHLEKRKRTSSNFDLDKLADIEYIDSNGDKFGYTGAEIEHSIKEAIQYKLAEGINKKDLKINGKIDISTDDVIDRLKGIIPICKIGQQNIEVMKKWASENATNVSKSSTIKVEQKRKPSKRLNLKDSIEQFEI